MQRLAKIIPDAEQVLALEPEELGGVLLLALKDENRLNPYNLINSLRNGFQPPYPEKHAFALGRAISEAWAWMTAQGLVARDYSQHGSDWFEITRRGERVAERAAFAEFRQGALLPRAMLHPRIEAQAWANFIRGAYDTAVFEAFRAVEIAVREAAGFPQGEHGVPMIRRAFHKETGPLTEPDAEEAEKEAMSGLFAGAIGSYKNPRSHREVGVIDASEASEMLVLASHLLRIVDERRHALTS